MSGHPPREPGAGRPVAVLAGDIRGSRKMPPPERGEVQDRLRKVLGDLEAALGKPGWRGEAPPLVSHLALVAGDEFQGVFLSPAAAILVVREVAERLHPHRIRFGLGWGTLTTRLSSLPTEMDGPAFHHAQEAMEAAKADETFVVFRGFGDPWDELLTAIFRLAGTIRDQWTSTRLRHIRAVRRHAALPASARGLLEEAGEATPSREATHTHHGREQAGSGDRGRDLASSDLFLLWRLLRDGEVATRVTGIASALPNLGSLPAPPARKFFHGAQKQAARELGIAPSTLSRSLKQADFFGVTSAEHLATRLLTWFEFHAPGAATDGQDEGSGPSWPWKRSSGPVP